MSNIQRTPRLRVGRYFAAVAGLAAAIGLIGRLLDALIG
jgi:hypothetical protein